MSYKKIGEKHHRVDVIYLCDYIGESDMKYHPDKNQIGYEWLEIATLNKVPLYPSKLRRTIMNYYEGKETSVYLGNENVGYPEITDVLVMRGRKWQRIYLKNTHQTRRILTGKNILREKISYIKEIMISAPNMREIILVYYILWRTEDLSIRHRSFLILIMTMFAQEWSMYSM